MRTRTQTSDFYDPVNIMTTDKMAAAIERLGLVT